jgi:cytosine/adenosine deaminase-related metal-dependent hydrolase
MAAGVPVALGTDSLASSPSLSILDEMRFVHQRDDQTRPEKLLQMATANGADALGHTGRVGRLVEGEEADLVAVRSAESGTVDPYESLLSPEAIVGGVWIRGRRVAGDG